MGINDIGLAICILLQLTGNNVYEKSAGVASLELFFDALVHCCVIKEYIATTSKGKDGVDSLQCKMSRIPPSAVSTCRFKAVRVANNRAIPMMRIAV